MLITIEGHQRMLTKVWFLQRIHVPTVPVTTDTERVVQSKLPACPFLWCTKVYSIHVPLLTWVPRLVILCYSFIERIPCASAGCHFPGFLTGTGQTTAGWRKRWERDPMTVFGIYYFIFSSLSAKGCWHPPWAIFLHFKLSWSPFYNDWFISSIHGYFCWIAGKEVKLKRDPYKIIDCGRHNIIFLTSSYLDPFREEVLFITNKEGGWQTAFKSKHKPENVWLVPEAAFNSLTSSLFRYYFAYFTHNWSKLVMNKIIW